MPDKGKQTLSIQEYPVEPPKGIFHFPQGVMCLIKHEDTGKESVNITRISGDEFEFEITPIDLTMRERKDFPIRICELEALEEEDIEKRPNEIVKSEKKIDITLNNKHRQVLKEGEILKIGNTVTYSAGDNLITLDDSAGAGDSWATAYDMDDVLSNCGAVVTKQGANAFDVSARMYFAAGVYFVSTDEFVELKPNPTNPSYAIASAAGSHIRIGEYNANGYSEKGSYWKVYTGACTGSNTNNFNGEVLIYGSMIWGDATAYQDGLHWSGSTRIYNSVLKIISYLWNVDTNLQDVKWYGSGGSYTTLYARGFTHTFAGITSINSNYGIFVSGTTNADFDVYDVTFINCNTSVFLSTYCAYLIRLVNSPTFVNVIAISAGRPGLKLCFTFNVKVTDDQGSPIVGAIVELKDVDGTNAFTPEQTVAGGVLAADKIVVKTWYRNAAQGGNKDYNDHTLKVTNGADETEYKIKIDHQMSEDIILIPQSVASYDSIMTAINDMKGTGFIKDTHSLTDIEERTTNLPDDPADQSLVEAAILTRAPAGEYDTEMGYIPADLADVATATELDAAHGAGSWETGGGGSDWGATEREQIRDALGVDGAKTKSVGGVMQRIKSIVDVILAAVS